MTKQFATIFFIALAILLFVLSLLTGSNGINISDLTKILNNDEMFLLILEQIRLPRALAAFFAGAALALSGALMQAVLKNPLASPFTLGISQASAFGASFAIIVLQSYSSSFIFGGNFITTLCAFISSLVCTFTILYLGKFSNMKSESLILAGVAIGALFGSMTMFLQYFATEIDVATTLFWTFGDISKASFTSALIIAGIFLPILFFFYKIFWQFDAMMMGNESAKSFGVNIEKLRIGAMILASLLSAVTVSFLGIIGFIGLIAPHIVRLIFGSGHKLLLPLSSLIGGGLLLCADIISRVILSPVIVPVGILTSFLGAPLFLYLLTRKKS
ncbi:FecCD family ABC transporter permease [Arcobacter sp. FWKO B]|uniref:FecCD family ABC transporter permease n=1 Tax=Arcobacter sp. FWKO B TaxID=2593672 RepID=UPI0018A641BD|nr:iron ABC transporter permease [Arcobacter sp. FWKO B]QOG12590.1 iron ABC transporter permease [Arcobacter sp. FWKO B]